MPTGCADSSDDAVVCWAATREDEASDEIVVGSGEDEMGDTGVEGDVAAAVGDDAL